MLTVGSLFSGIGGFDLGFERAGFAIKWQVEIDPFCRQVLAKHWPDVRRYEDVREVHGDGEGHSYFFGSCYRCLPAVDVLCGGFPCQDISLAGPGEGIDGARSGLWSEFARLISELRPRYVVVENVAALLIRGLGRVVGDLAALGYDAEWDCLPASAFGAAHERDRLFVIAYPVRQGLSVRRQAGAHETDAAIFGAGAGSALRTTLARLERGGDTQWRGDVHGIPRRMDRIKALGNSVIPQACEWIAERIKEAEAQRVTSGEAEATA